MEIAVDELLTRFKNYTSISTGSDDKATCFPSTARQLDLAKYLVAELQDLGLEEVEMTEHGYVLATLPATTKEPLPVMGLLAHMDTSSEACGENVKVCLHKNYEGGDLALGHGTVLSPKDFPELANYVGQDLLTAGGDTLLGADDKAGIAAIVTACAYALAHPELPHGKVRLGFTPDEEVGRGTEHFPLEKFAADYAYTIDGGELGELNYETFNATNATVVFNGVSVHPGSAKNKMRNAITMAAEWQLALPAFERPEYTENYEGFYHSLRISGGTDRVEMDMILRDHNKEILAGRKEFLQSLVKFMEAKYGPGSVELTMKDCYSNMKEHILPMFQIVDKACAAMRAVGVEPLIRPVRGGTDGANLSAMGLPCPNIFTGGHNFHGRWEYLPLQSFVKATEVVVELIYK